MTFLSEKDINYDLLKIDNLAGTPLEQLINENKLVYSLKIAEEFNVDPISVINKQLILSQPNGATLKSISGSTINSDTTASSKGYKGFQPINH